MRWISVFVEKLKSITRKQKEPAAARRAAAD
jgi:hypothetical protein